MDVIITIVCLFFSAFFSGAETGLLSVSRERILHLARKGGRRAKIIQHAISDMERTTTAILIGNNIANVSYSTASAATIFALISDDTARSTGCFIAAGLILYFGEFLPKLLFSSRPLHRTVLIAPIFQVVTTILLPHTWLAMKLTDALMPGKNDEQRTTIAEVMRIIRDRQDGVCLSNFEHALITHVLFMRAKGEPITKENVYAALKNIRQLADNAAKNQEDEEFSPPS